MFQEPSLPEGIIINQWIFGFFLQETPLVNSKNHAFL